MRYLVPLSALLVVACGPDEGASNAAPVAECPVLDSRDWSAWVDAEPGTAPTLHIRGEADMPTPGYAYVWRVGAADRMMPPGQHIHIDFAAPEGVVAQVVTPTQIVYEGEATYPQYRQIIVHCGDQALATITEIPVAG